MPAALGRQQARRPHETQHAVAPDPMPEGTQTHPYLAVPFAVKWTLGQDLSDASRSTASVTGVLGPRFAPGAGAVSADPACA